MAEGLDRRTGERDRRSGGWQHLEIRGWIIGVVLVLGLGIFFAASYLNATRQRDLLNIACGNAEGHRDLTIAVKQSAALTAQIAHELGLPVEPHEIQVPSVPSECSGPGSP